MRFTDDLWCKKWHKPPYQRILEESAALPGTGSGKEPRSSLWCASLSEAMGTRFREGMTITDYGCGSGRYFNWLTGWLKDFTYYGLDIDTKYGNRCLAYAEDRFGRDPRACFGHVWSNLAEVALAKCDVLLLASVFTHLATRSFKKLFPIFYPIMDRGGLIVFSAIIKESYKKARNKAYDTSNAYSHVWYTQEQIADFFARTPYRLKEREHFLEVDLHPHTIYQVYKEEDSR